MNMELKRLKRELDNIEIELDRLRQKEKTEGLLLGEKKRYSELDDLYKVKRKIKIF